MLCLILFSLIALSSASNEIIVLNENNYAEVMASNKPVLILLYMEPCITCETMLGTFAALPRYAEKKGYNIVVAKVNTGEYMKPAIDFNVDFFPNVVLHNKGVSKTVPVVTRMDTFFEFIDKAIGAESSSNTKTESEETTGNNN
eukprot:TRINITY_DN3255_c0_g2_i4.p1 TRINITY_DN3255_c0_g2~~TRINITY_DN3255_c0_g2_i4.p1  ORF type:complete len:144 (-),score=45.67 TRINITY_DN3255_c0_g2_i4:151-582(-)